jgi:hypothetical protein
VPSAEASDAAPALGETPGPAPAAVPAQDSLAAPAGAAAVPSERPAASPPEAPQPGAKAEDPLDELRRRWPEIVVHISQHPPTKPLIAACRPIAVEGNTVVLGFPEEQAFLKDVAERRRAILEEGVGRYLGRDVAVRCVATNLDLVAPLPEDEAAGRLLDEARRIFADDLLDVGEVG